jgi:AI-2 transport protein TqsA
MHRSATPALWIIASAAVVAGLYFFRDVLTQFSLALILYLMIDSLARELDERVPLMPRVLSLPIAFVLILGLVSVVVWVIVRNFSGFVDNAGLYEARLDQLIVKVYATFGISGAAPTFSEALRGANPARLLADIGGGLQSIASDVMFILIFTGFMFSAGGTMGRRLTQIFRDKEDRLHAMEVLTSIRASIDRYLYVQTVISLIISSLTYATLVLIGLDNAIFWSFVIFFLNFIPTIGSIVAVALPTAFALVQFPDLTRILFVAGGVGFWQFAIGNFLQPRMTGESLNLSAVVVLLALSMWGAVWGIAGAFLAAPLTVMIMIVCAQFRSTYWIAVLLSANARPTRVERPVLDSEHDA